jgi:Trm5-related predicted tRNA methylase
LFFYRGFGIQEIYKVIVPPKAIVGRGERTGTPDRIKSFGTALLKLCRAGKLRTM